MQPSRRPDGTPEIRSVDDLLADAVTGLAIHELPGGGAPIDLSSYFAAGPEHRVGNKLLADNRILPHHLHLRLKLEQAVHKAVSYFEEQRPRLNEDLRAARQAANAFLPRHSQEDGRGNDGVFLTGDLAPFPLPLCAASALAPTAPGERSKAARRFAATLSRYRNRRRVAASTYDRLLTEVRDLMDEMRQEGIGQGALQPLPLPIRDLNTTVDAFRRVFPDPPAPPADLVEQLRHRAGTPSRWWKRLWRRLYGAVTHS